MAYKYKGKHGNTLDRTNILFECNNSCMNCGWSINIITRSSRGVQWSMGIEVHHIVPQSDGGSNEFENLIGLCRNCHFMADVGLISRDHLFSLKCSIEELEEKSYKILKDYFENQ